jgi:hypothetical protein
MSNATNGVTGESGTQRPGADATSAAESYRDQGDTGLGLLSTSRHLTVSPRTIRRNTLIHASPITVGTIAILVLFTYLRLSSNRCVAPVTLFDWLLNVALGSTLAGIVNGTSLVRGLISLITLMAFQFLRFVSASCTR